jgi:hypothetical protein
VYLVVNVVTQFTWFFSFQKCIAAKKLKQSVGNKSMSFPNGKSDRYVVAARPVVPVGKSLHCSAPWGAAAEYRLGASAGKGRDPAIGRPLSLSLGKQRGHDSLMLLIIQPLTASQESFLDLVNIIS